MTTPTDRVPHRVPTESRPGVYGHRVPGPSPYGDPDPCDRVPDPVPDPNPGLRSLAQCIDEWAAHNGGAA
jgi:hypothetical protein